MKKGQVSEIWNSKVCDSICNGKYDYVSENYVLFCRFGIFPSWGLSQKLSRIIGPNRAREISLSGTPILADQAERWGLVNHVVEGSQILIKARQVAEAIMKNNQDLVLKYKAVINDGFKQDLSEALKLEKVVYLSFFLSLSTLYFSCLYCMALCLWYIWPREFDLRCFLVFLFQERAHEYYNGMTKEQFKKMQEFISGRSSKKPASKM